jgi:hypothetical protein
MGRAEAKGAIMQKVDEMLVPIDAQIARLCNVFLDARSRAANHNRKSELALWREIREIVAGKNLTVTRKTVEQFVEGSLCKAMDCHEMADAVQLKPTTEEMLEWIDGAISPHYRTYNDRLGHDEVRVAIRALITAPKVIFTKAELRHAQALRVYETLDIGVDRMTELLRSKGIIVDCHAQIHKETRE